VLTVLRKVTLYGTALFILLILVSMVVDLLFPGTTNIVANLSSLINQFIDAGLAGLVAFIVVVALFYRPFIVPSSSLSPWASMLSGLLVDRCYRVYREFRR